jgi:hypothetical protein
MQSDAIVVLSGALPVRVIEAAHLHRQNFAARAWISPGLSSAPELEALGIAYVGESFYNQKVLIDLLIPA